MTKSNNISDLALISEFKKSHSQEVLAGLYKDYIPLIYGVGLKYLQNASDAEDLTMTVYEHISNKLKTHKVDNFRAWLFVVTKNLCFEKLRKQKRITQKENEAALVYSESVFHPDNIEDKDLIGKLNNCLKMLKDEQRQCVEDFYYKTMSYNVIAEKYNLSWNRVRSYIQNGRRMLKNCIEKSA